MCNNAHSEYFDILIRRADHKNQCAITCAHMLSHMTRNPTTNTSSAPCALVARTEISSFGQLVRDQTACHSTQKATITALRERCMLRAAGKLCWHMQTAAASGFVPLALAPPIRVIMNHMRVRMRGFRSFPCDLGQHKNQNTRSRNQCQCTTVRPTTPAIPLPMRCAIP